MKQYNFPDILKGDTFKARDVVIKNETTQTPIDLTGCEIRCEFRKNTKVGAVIETLIVGNGITLSDPTNGIFTIDNFNADWDADVYYYDFQFTFPNDVVQTYFGGYMKLIQDVTQNPV
jgi:hypothetical protein